MTNDRRTFCDKIKNTHGTTEKLLKEPPQMEFTCCHGNGRRGREVGEEAGNDPAVDDLEG